jgi:hypothetical protein
VTDVDALSIVLAVLAFALLLGLVYGIERI